MFGIENFNVPIVDFSNFEIGQLFNALLFGGAILLIGMVAVFSVLCILWLFLVVFKLVFHDLPEKKRKKLVSEVIVTANENVVENKNNDEEIIAVISAAIAMAESDDSGMKFKVVSFKRT